MKIGMKIFLTLILLLFDYSALYSQWQLLSSAPNITYNYLVNDNGILYAATFGSGIYKSTDSSSTWHQVNSGLNTNQAQSVYQILFSGNELFAATVGGIYKSTNGGSNWIKKSNGIVVGGGASYEFTVSIFEDNSVLFTGAYTGIYRSTNDGENWVVTNISGTEVMAGFFVNHNGSLFAARESINLPYGYTSTDNGMTWGFLNSTGVPIITFLSEGLSLWAGTIDGVWLSTNNGSTWTMRNSGLSPDPYSSSIIRVNGALVTSLKFGGSGIYRSFNNGLNWVSIGDGLPFLNSIEQLMIYGNKVLAMTSNGIWERNISEIVTSVTKQSNQVPGKFQLHQNYPNPFNPSATIRFDIPLSNDQENSNLSIRLMVYDLLGNKIALLVNEKLLPGSYSVSWDAAKYPSGVYIYRMEAGSFSETRKMTLVK